VIRLPRPRHHNRSRLNRLKSPLPLPASAASH
jgi:hypothetical protein